MRLVLRIGNVNVGGGTNLALQVHHLDPMSAIPLTTKVAQLIAFAQYQSEATDSYVDGVDYGDDAPGPLLPAPFPTAAYAALVVANTDLIAMTSFGQSLGLGNLAPLGAGMVLSKRSATPGRTGRGRLTTPWLGVGAVTADGIANGVNTQSLADGYYAYLMGDGAGLGIADPVNLEPYIYPANAPIIAATVTNRLGRLRSRTA